MRSTPSSVRRLHVPRSAPYETDAPLHSVRGRQDAEASRHALRRHAWPRQTSDFQNDVIILVTTRRSWASHRGATWLSFTRSAALTSLCWYDTTAVFFLHATHDHHVHSSFVRLITLPSMDSTPLHTFPTCYAHFLGLDDGPFLQTFFFFLTLLLAVLLSFTDFLLSLSDCITTDLGTLAHGLASFLGHCCINRTALAFLT